MSRNLHQIRNKILIILIGVILLGCDSNNVVINQFHLPNNNWTYLNKIYTVFEPKEEQRYNLYLSVRISAEYKYSNLFILFKIKDKTGKEVIRRYTYKIADSEGQWKGSGSGNIYAYKLPLLTNRSFPNEKILLSIEQNMKDNPLKGVTDVGIIIEKED